MEKQIPRNSVIDLDRFINYQLVLSDEELVIQGSVFYKDANGQTSSIAFSSNPTFKFSTINSYVDPTTGATVSRDVNGDYPIGSIPQLVFFKNLPKTAFPQTNVWDIVLYLVGGMIDTLVLEGKFDNL